MLKRRKMAASIIYVLNNIILIRCHLRSVTDALLFSFKPYIINDKYVAAETIIYL